MFNIEELVSIYKTDPKVPYLGIGLAVSMHANVLGMTTSATIIGIIAIILNGVRFPVTSIVTFARKEKMVKISSIVNYLVKSFLSWTAFNIEYENIGTQKEIGELNVSEELNDSGEIKNIEWFNTGFNNIFWT